MVKLTFFKIRKINEYLKDERQGDALGSERACHTNHQLASWNSAKEPEAVAHICNLSSPAGSYKADTYTDTLHSESLWNGDGMADIRDRISKDGESQEPSPETCPLPFKYVLCHRWHPHFHTCMLRTQRHFSLKIDFARFSKVNAQFSA